MVRSPTKRFRRRTDGMRALQPDGLAIFSHTSPAPLPCSARGCLVMPTEFHAEGFSPSGLGPVNYRLSTSRKPKIFGNGLTAIPHTSIL